MVVVSLGLVGYFLLSLCYWTREEAFIAIVREDSSELLFEMRVSFVWFAAYLVLLCEYFLIDLVKCGGL